MRLVGLCGIRLVVFFLALAALASNIACGGLIPQGPGATAIPPTTTPPAAAPPATAPSASPVTTPPTSTTPTQAQTQAPAPHQVDLSWNPSASLVDGYFVYRSLQPGGPYTRLNAIPVAITFYRDIDVLGGQTYYYVVAATVGAMESVYSNEMAAAVPTP